MNNFKIIYKILKHLEKSLEVEQVDISMFNHEMFNIDKSHFDNILIMLLDAEYIKGVTPIHSIGGSSYVKIVNPTITLKGLEYLEENSLMKKASNIIKGIADII